MDNGPVVPWDEYDATRMGADADHAEALEMDAAGEALTQAHAEAMMLLPGDALKRWRYRAHRMTRHGAFLGVLEGYITAPDAAEVERQVRVHDGALYSERWRLGNFNITRA